MKVEDGISLAEKLINRNLTELELLIFRESWQGRNGKKYREIAGIYHCKEGTVNDEASRLWKSLSEALGNEKVLKSNFKRVLEDYWRSLSENTPKNEGQVVDEAKPQLLDFVGRDAAIAELENFQKKGAKIIAIYGHGGIGKTTLAEKYLERQKVDILRLQIGTESQDVPSVEQWVKYLLKNNFQEEPNPDFSIMLEQLKTKLKILKCALLIDNLEPALNKNGNFLEAHNSYIKLLKILADSTVKSLTLITSRERINDSRVNVERYDLSGLDEKAWRDFFSYKEIDCSSSSLVQIQRACGGNAKAMKIIYAVIKNDYENNLDNFWQDYGQNLLKTMELQDLIKRQFERLKNIAPDSYKLIIRMGIFPYSKIPRVSRNLVMCLLWDIPEAEKYQVIECLKNRYLVEFKNREFWLHPIIRSEAMSRLHEIGESSSEIIFKFKQQNDLVIYSNNNLYNLFKWLSYKFVFAPSKYKKAAFRALMLGIVLDNNNYASQNYVDLSIDIDDCFENMKPEQLTIYAENSVKEQLSFIFDKLHSKIRIKQPSIFLSYNDFRKLNKSLFRAKKLQMMREVIEEYIDEIYEIHLKHIHKMLDICSRIEFEIYIEIIINIVWNYYENLILEKTGKLDKIRNYMTDDYYSAYSNRFIDRTDSKQDLKNNLLSLNELAYQKDNLIIKSNIDKELNIKTYNEDNERMRVFIFIEELIDKSEAKISIKEFYLEEKLIDDYEDKITESKDNFDWQFTDNEQELLTQYCQANRLIVECLNNLPSEVREEIE